MSTIVVEEKISSRKDKIRPFFFDVQSDKNPFFEVFKVPKTKGIALDKFDEIIGRFQFGDDFLVCNPINNTNNFDISIFNVKQFRDKM